MAGIKANSASVTMLDGDTGADNSNSGYVTAEQIILSATPTGSSYTWGLAIPSGSASARSGLSSTTAAAPVFTPDVGGTYTITCDVDGTSYVLRLTVTQVAIASSTEALRLSPIADTAVPAPAKGVAVFYSETQDALALKYSSGYVSTPTALPTQHFNVGKLGTPAVAPTPGTPDTNALAVFSQFNVPRKATINAIHLHGIEDQSSGTITIEVYRRRSAVMTLLGSATLTGGGGDFATNSMTISDTALQSGDYLYCQLTAYSGGGGYDGITVDVHLTAADL